MFWPPILGDAKNQLERFTFTGITATYSRKGMLYAKLTATAVELYRDVDLASGDKVASGSHATPTTWTKITLSEANSSGISGSCYLKYDSVDSGIHVWPTFATDTELGVVMIDFAARFPKSSGTTFADQHRKTMEDFVREMQSRIPPRFGRRGAERGTLRGEITNIWRVNSVGDYELTRLANIEAYREWALWHTVAMIIRLPTHILPADTQQLLIRDAEEMASKAWAGTLPLCDQDDDFDADAEIPRFSVQRG